VPFRESHGLAGQAVRRAEELGTSLKALPLAEYQAIHPAFDETLYAVLDFQQSVASRDVEGGTAPAAVRAQLRQARAALSANREFPYPGALGPGETNNKGANDHELPGM